MDNLLKIKFFSVKSGTSFNKSLSFLLVLLSVFQLVIFLMEFLDIVEYYLVYLPFNFSYFFNAHIQLFNNVGSLTMNGQYFHLLNYQYQGLQS